MIGCGTAGTPEKSLGYGESVLSAQTLTFLATTIGSNSAVGMVTLSNGGAAALQLGNPTLSDPSDFTVNSSCTSSLAAGASCSYSVTFRPQSTGTIAGTLTLDVTGAAPGMAQPVVNLIGSGTPVPVAGVAFSATSLTFPQITVGAVSAPQSVTLNNPGTATLHLATIMVSDPTQFQESSTCGVTLAPNASCQISVSFAPAAIGAINATLTLTDDSGGVAGTTQAVTLSGTGLAVPEPMALISPESLTFASTVVNSVTAVQVVTVTNSGNAPLAIGGVLMSDTADYTETSACGSSLAAGASCTIQVMFQPKTSGALPGTLVLTDNSGGVSGTTQRVSLAGVGLPLPEPVATVSPGQLVFAQTTVGQASAAQTVVLSNTGTATLSISGMVLSDGADFVFSSACGTQLAAGASCAIAVSSKPASTGNLNATLTISDNGSGTGVATQQVVTLTGTAIAPPPPAPQAVLSAGALVFPKTMLTEASAAQTLTLSNTGNAALTLAAVTVSDTANFSATNNCGATLAIGASCAITVAFGPQALGAVNATLTMTDNSGLSGTGTVQQVVPLSGTGIAFDGPRAAVSPSILQFVPVLARQSDAAQTVMLTNTGTQPLTVSGVTLGPGSASGFAIATNACGATLPAGASCAVTVKYAPTAPSASDTGTVMFANDGQGQNAGTQTVALTGKAWAEVDSVTNFGDSITCGFYAQPNDGTGLIWSLEGYASLFDAWLNLQNGAADNSCRQGDEAADMGRLWVPFNSAPALGANQLYTAMIGVNDAYVNGAAEPQLSAYAAEVGAAYAWLTIPREHKVLANAITQQTGTWTADVGFGLKSSVPGSSLTFQVNQGIAGENLYVVYHVWSTPAVQAGTVSIAVDGSVQAAVAGADPGFNGTQNGTFDTYFLVRVPLGAAGQHSVTLTHTGTTGTTVGILWAGVPQMNYQQTAGAPRLLVGGITTSPSGNQVFQRDRYNIQLYTSMNSLAADGLNIVMVPTDTALDPGSDFVDLLHPNNAGHAKLSKVFEQYR